MLRPITYARPSSSSPLRWPAKLSKPEQALVLDCARFSWLAYSAPKTVAAWWTAKKANTLTSDPAKPAASDAMLHACAPPDCITCPSCDAQCCLITYKPPAGISGLGEEPVLVLAVRGTTSFTDWLEDARVNLTQFRDATDGPVEGVKVHEGFYTQFIALFSLVDRRIKAHLDAGGKLICCGHSLGGGTSTIAALNYGNTYPGAVWHASFGSPRTGNEKFKQRYQHGVKLQCRIKHARDPVPAAIPPIDYVHVTEETHLGERDPYPEIPVMFDVGDHSIAKYVASIQNPDVSMATVPLASNIGRWLLDALHAKP